LHQKDRKKEKPGGILTNAANSPDEIEAWMWNGVEKFK
jgi:hypothetical protein